MTDTDKLIELLATRARAVRPIASPLRRTMLWLALAAAVIVAIVLVHGLRQGAWQALSHPAAALEWCASVLTGMLAAYALFHVSVPGRSASWAWLPLPAAVLWLGGIGWGCVAELLRIGPAALAFEPGHWQCAWVITLTSVPLGLVLLLMVRHAGVVRPAPSAMLAGLSAAALSAAGVTLYHEGESALMVLVWHAGAVLVLSALSWLFGRTMFGWIGYSPRRSD